MEGREWALGDFRKPGQIYSAKEDSEVLVLSEQLPCFLDLENRGPSFLCELV